MENIRIKNRNTTWILSNGRNLKISKPRKRKKYWKKKLKKNLNKRNETEFSKPWVVEPIFHATERERERCRISDSSSLSQHLAAAYLLSAPTWTIHPFLDHRGFSLSLWQRLKSQIGQLGEWSCHSTWINAY